MTQYDLLTLPEYPPPADRVSPDPFLSTPKAVKLFDSKDSAVTVYVPALPASQFWIVYSITPPYPPNALYYFKLFLDDEHIVSWGCSDSDGFKGKTMFNMEARADGSWERNVFCFSPKPWLFGGKQKSLPTPKKPSGVENKIEVKVYRARSRKRTTAPLPEKQPPEKKPSVKPQTQTQTPAAGAAK